MPDDEFKGNGDTLGEALRALREMPVPDGPPQETVNCLASTLSRMRETARCPQTRRRLRIAERIGGMRLSAKLASAALLAAFVCAAAVLMVMGAQKPLYAQIAEAVGKARSFHVLQHESRGGGWYSDFELWYDRELGGLEKTRHKDRTYMRIDDGEYEWRYAEGGKIVAKRRSFRPHENWVSDLLEWVKFEPIRDPATDMTADGEKLRAYALPEEGPERTRIWVDEKNRIRRFEADSEMFGERVHLKATVEYDVPIDQKRFSPEFSAGARIVDPLEFLQARFPLEGALFTKEAVGMVFAVHDLRQCEGGLAYLVCSTRITDENRRAIGTGHPWTFYGQSNVMARWQDAATTGYCDRILLLARMKHDGLQVDWYLVVPGSDVPADAETCDVDVNISAANQLEERLKEEELEVRKTFRLTIGIPKSEDEERFASDIVSEVYATAAELAPLVHGFSLTEVKAGADGAERNMIWRQPTAVSQEGYTENMHERVAREVSTIEHVRAGAPVARGR